MLSFMATTPSLALLTASGALTNLAGAGRVAIPKIKPQCAILAQHAPNLAEHLDHRPHIVPIVSLKADLAGDAVIS